MATSGLTGLASCNRRLDGLVTPAAKRKHLRAIATEVRDEARPHAWRKTGKTRRLVRVAKVTTKSARVTSAGAGVFQEGGAAPHGIRAKRARALAFTSQHVVTERFGAKAKLRTKRSGALSGASAKRFGSGAFLVVRGVRHPGVKKEPFLRPAALRVLHRVRLGPGVVERWNKGGTSSIGRAS